MAFRWKRIHFSVSDYLTLGLAIGLAFAVWLVSNLFQTYSNVEQVPVRVTCNIQGHDNHSNSVVSIAARCQVSGFRVLAGKMWRPEIVDLEFDSEDVHHLEGDRYYVTGAELEKYFHNIFTGGAKLDYFITDTLFMEFPSVQCKKVPVISRQEITCAQQYMQRGPLKLDPEYVYLYGSENELASLDAVYTNTVYLTNLDGDSYGEVKLEPISGIRYSTDHVNYFVNVVRYVQLKTMVKVSLEGAPKDKSFVLSPSEAMVNLTVKYPLAHRYEHLEIRLDYNDWMRSASGKCIGHLSERNDDILGADIYPEVFECREVVE